MSFRPCTVVADLSSRLSRLADWEERLRQCWPGKGGSDCCQEMPECKLNSWGSVILGDLISDKEGKIANRTFYFIS